MPEIDRKTAEVRIKQAGYHEHPGTFQRVWINSGLSKKRALELYKIGQKQKENGMKCECRECQKETTN